LGSGAPVREPYDPSVTRYAEHLADAWAEFWSSRDASAVGRIYARPVAWWDVARGRGTELTGHDGVAAARDSHHAVARDLRLFVVRVIPGDAWVATEFVAVATEAGGRVGVPGCAWWRVDDDGRITREHWYWDWERRRVADETLAGHVPRGAGGDRGPRWYQDFASRLLATWDDDPPTMVDALYAPSVLFDTMGAGPDGVIRGAPTLRAAELRLADTLVERHSKVAEVAGSGPLVAFTHFTEARTPTGPRRTTPVARVLTVDENDLVVGDHTYLLRAWPARARR
jgi:hypothetical protein